MKKVLPPPQAITTTTTTDVPPNNRKVTMPKTINNVQEEMIQVRDEFITLISEEGVRIGIEERISKKIGILENVLQSFQLFGSTDSPLEFPLSPLSSTIIIKIIDWLKERPDSENQDNDNDDHSEEEEEALFGQEYLNEDYLLKLSPWDRNFFDRMDLELLVDITKGANFMNIPLLLDQCCRQLAKIISGMKPDELRRKFNLPNDLTKEEKDKIGEEFAFINEND